MNDYGIRMESFSEADFDTLISWISSEKELVQFAGPTFRFPLTKEQLSEHLEDSRRYAFKIIHTKANQPIGYCEAYHADEQNGRLCRVIIGDKNYRGKGYGTLLAKLLTAWTFDNLHVNSINLNVYDFNAAAIRSYENAGFKKMAVNEMTTQIENENWGSFKMAIEREVFYKKFRPYNSE